MINFIIHHVLFKPIASFVLGIGGLFRWCLFKIFNAAFENKYSEDLEYYMDNKNEVLDKNGLKTSQKNFLVGIFIIIYFILLIEFLEKNF